MPTKTYRPAATPQKKNILEAMVQAGDKLTDRTRPLPKYVEQHLEMCASDLLHLWLADADPDFYGRMMKTEL